jgi:site-specific recombinase XerD
MAERFSEWLEAINYSPKTRVNYTRDVKLFLTWLAENTAINSIVEVTPAHLQQYQIALYNFARHDDKEPTVMGWAPSAATCCVSAPTSCSLQ